MKIVVVDDSSTWRAIIKGLFVSKGYEVEIATDGLDGYFKIHEIHPDIVVSDVVMPGLNGYQLCRLVKNDPVLSGIPVILMTSSSESLDRFWGRYSGANAYIQKDSKDDLELLESKITEMEKELRPVEKKIISNGKLTFAETFDSLLVKTTLESEVRKLFNHVEDMDYTIQKVIEFVRNLLELDSVSFLILSVDESVMYTPISDVEKIEDLMFSMLSRPSYPLKRRHVLVEGSSEIEGLKSTTRVISFDSKEYGVFSIWRKRGFTSREENALSIICEELGGILKIGVQFALYRHNANMDELTGLANFRALEERISSLWNGSEDFSFAMMDIDHFKKVNDKYGHAIGNEVLSEIGRIILEISSESGIFAARFGGEEFALLSEKRESLFEIVETVRRRVGSSSLSKSVPDLTVTISGGVAERDGARSYTEVLENADAALYVAKKEGRNRVITFK